MKRCPAAYLDGVEVMNGNPRHDSHNEDAAAYCRANGLIGISGSDFHQWEDLAIGGLDFTGPVTGSPELIARLRAGEFVRICEKTERCLTKRRTVSFGNIGKNAEKSAENNSLLTNPAQVYIIFCVTL